jgi:hypothetical protein
MNHLAAVLPSVATPLFAGLLSSPVGVAHYLVVGAILGLVGAGGAVLAVPAFLFLFNFTALQATTASLAVVAASAATVPGAPDRKAGGGGSSRCPQDWSDQI